MKRAMKSIPILLWMLGGALFALAAELLLLSLGLATGYERIRPLWGKGAVLAGLSAAIFLLLRALTKRAWTAASGPGTSSDPARFEPLTLVSLLPERLAGPRHGSFAAVAAGALVVALLPTDALLFGEPPRGAPVRPARTVEAVLSEDGNPERYLLCPDKPLPEGSARLRLMLIDGNRNGKVVPFPHDDHPDFLGEEEACGSCHHMHLPFDMNSSCAECHRDMHATTDIFSHASHIEKLGGNRACPRCHADPQGAKGRETATPCAACHSDMEVRDAFLDPAEGGLRGYAVGYQDAMHGLCIGCHFETEEAADCGFCHRNSLDLQLRQQGPYAAGLSEK